MATSKPIRLLAATTMALFVFILIQMMRKPSTIQPPGYDDGKMAEMTRDPNLDGKGPLCACDSFAEADQRYRNWRAPGTIAQSEWE